MGIEVLDSSSDLNNVILENSLDSDDLIEEGFSNSGSVVDSRRRLENKIEEMKLLRDVQEFDFDV